MNTNAIEPEQAALAARKAEYLARATAIHPTNPAFAAELAQGMENAAASGRNRRQKLATAPDHCPWEGRPTQCRRPVCRCYPDRGTERGGRERTLSR